MGALNPIRPVRSWTPGYTRIPPRSLLKEMMQPSMRGRSFWPARTWIKAAIRRPTTRSSTVCEYRFRDSCAP